MSNVTGVPVTNAEFFQVLRYEPGQFYKVCAARERGRLLDGYWMVTGQLLDVSWMCFVTTGSSFLYRMHTCTCMYVRMYVHMYAYLPQVHHDQNSAATSLMGVRLFVRSLSILDAMCTHACAPMHGCTCMYRPRHPWCRPHAYAYMHVPSSSTHPALSK